MNEHCMIKVTGVIPMPLGGEGCVKVRLCEGEAVWRRFQSWIKKQQQQQKTKWLETQGPSQSASGVPCDQLPCASAALMVLTLTPWPKTTFLPEVASVRHFVTTWRAPGVPTMICGFIASLKWHVTNYNELDHSDAWANMKLSLYENIYYSNGKLSNIAASVQDQYFGWH